MLTPPENTGMLSLDKKAFEKQLNVTALKIDVKKSSLFMKTLDKYLLNMKRYRNIVEDPEYIPEETDNTTIKRKRKSSPIKYILLSPKIKKDLSNVPEEIQTFIKNECMEIKDYTITIDYDYWSTDDILRSIIPNELQIPGSFETVGHIAHLNLRDEYIPYKKIIGEVVLDKNKHIRTVVNKTGKIDNTFRFFEMELLAGVWDMNAELRESNCKFIFDFSKVYWNSRLQGEHERLVKKFKKDEFICDVFAGVGPFALPAAKNIGAFVFANDLNPSSYQYLKENIKENKLVNKVFPYNLDGRDFIKESMKYLNDPKTLEKIEKQKKYDRVEALKRKSRTAAKIEIEKIKKEEEEEAKNSEKDLQQKPFLLFNHYIMNLPAIAIEFLDAFRGIFKDFKDKISIENLPTIHCHCFSKAEDPKNDVITRVEKAIGSPLDKKYIKEIHLVRTVAPNKDMFCISFILPPEIAFLDEKEVVVNSKRKSECENELTDNDQKKKN